MPRLPILPAREIVRGLRRLGFDEVGQRGSHLKLLCGATTAIVPIHRDVRRGTLASVLDQAGITLDALIDALAH